MPIYEYTCQGCNTKFDKLVRAMSPSTGDRERVKCPSCGSIKTARSMSVFAVGAETRTSPIPSGGMCGRCGGEPGSCAMGG